MVDGSCSTAHHYVRFYLILSSYCTPVYIECKTHCPTQSILDNCLSTIQRVNSKGYYMISMASTIVRIIRKIELYILLKIIILGIDWAYFVLQSWSRSENYNINLNFRLTFPHTLIIGFAKAT